MALFEIIAVLITLSAFFAWINERLFKLPTAIGLMLGALLMSLFLLAPIPGTEGLENDLKAMLGEIDFNAAVLHGMLSLLLFAGALHVNLADLAQHRRVIGFLASAGVLISTLIVGLGAWGLFALLGLHVPLIYCFLFGALISPTDPIAVLGILKTAGAPKSLETKITGESLFNDGTAVVLFLVLYRVAMGGDDITLFSVAGMFVQEAVGGVLLGLATGWLAYLMLARVDNYQVEVLITLALAAGGYAGAEHLHLSAPITVVVSGLMIGNRGRSAMSLRTREHLDTFWELVDEVMNAVLFVMIGLEVLVLTVTESTLLAAVLLIPLVLLARALSAALPMAAMNKFKSFAPASVGILTWGGLRGGISVALVLALPESPIRDVLLTVTYVVVAFSIIVQGLTLAPLIRATGHRATLELERVELPELIPDGAR